MPRNNLRKIKRRTIDPVNSKKSYGIRGLDKRQVRKSRPEYDFKNKVRKSRRRREGNDKTRENYNEFQSSNDYQTKNNISE
ncbi:MAG: hypothetical protein HeimC2_10690 [Candidatus Heimdallarchaeota archaeon LC_2]|nr:MAG: hypothetical protein HeimC2_10690 [Candidatus Heimdallarchaeota archaeon LC_2]